MTYYTPDITGKNPDYKLVNQVYSLFQTNQKIEFETPVFVSSFTMKTIGLDAVYLFEGTDYKFLESDLDYTSMSKMKVYDPTFSEILAKSVTITKEVPAQFSVSVEYQQLYQVTSRSALFNNQLVEVTPSLILELMTRISNIEALSTTVQGTTASTDVTPKLLPLDMTKSLPGNLVSGEVHTLNVFQGVNVIRPVCGSFYRDSVTIKIPNTRVLEKDVDYIVFGANLPKTKTTSNTSGVFDFILITYPYAGELEVGYHAYGGEVTTYDVSAIYNALQDIKTYLNDTAFVTSNALPLVPAFQTLNARTVALEDMMRSLLTTGKPTYGDSTNGKTITKKLRSVDVQHHWWTIASLYKVEGSNDTVVADRALYRIRLLNSKISADVTLAVDLNAPQPFTIDATGVVMDRGVTSVYGESHVAPIITPQFRILWNQDYGAVTGMYLQIGLALPSLIETLAIEDRSGVESCWILSTASADAVLPDEVNIMLPDQATLWDPLNPDSKQISHVLPVPDGYMAWVGSVAGASINALYTVDHQLPSSFIIDDIRSLVLEFTPSSGDTSKPIRIEVPITGSTSNKRSGLAILPNAVDNTLGLGTVTATITKTTSITLTLKAPTLTSEWDLRYIFAKV